MRTGGLSRRAYVVVCGICCRALIRVCGEVGGQNRSPCIKLHERTKEQNWSDVLLKSSHLNSLETLHALRSAQVEINRAFPVPSYPGRKDRMRQIKNKVSVGVSWVSRNK